MNGSEESSARREEGGISGSGISGRVGETLGGSPWRECAIGEAGTTERVAEMIPGDTSGVNGEVATEERVEAVDIVF